MPRGTYDVQDPSSVDVVVSKGAATPSLKQDKRDTSYRACIHALVIFVIFCIILMLAAWPWGSPHRNKQLNATAEEHKGQYVSTSTTRRPTSNDPVPTNKPVSTVEEKTTTQSDTVTHHIPKVITDLETSTAEVYVTTSPYVQENDETHPTTDQIARRPLNTVVPDYVTTAPADIEMYSTDQSSSIAELETTTVAPPTQKVIMSTDVDEKDSLVTDPLPTDNGETTQHSVTITNYSEREIIQNIYSTTEPTATHNDSTDSDTLEPNIVTTIATTDAVMHTTVVEEGQQHIDDIITEDLLTTILDDATTEGIQSGTPEQQPSSEVENFSNHSTENQPVAEYLIDIRSTTELAVTTSPDAVCSSSSCKVLATRMLSLMDHEVDPCDDFYAFSCGGLRTNKALNEVNPDDDPNARIKSEILKIGSSSCAAKLKFKSYYDSCVAFKPPTDLIMKQKRINTVKSMLKEVGIFHTKKTWTPENADITQLISRLMLHHSTPLFDVTLDVDGGDTNKMAFKLGIPEFQSVFRQGISRPDCIKSTDEVTNLSEYYEDYVNCTALPSKEYMDKVKEVLEKLEMIRLNDETNIKQVNLEIVTSIEFDLLQIDADNTNTAHKMPTAAERRIALLSKTYDEMTVTWLQSEIPSINWKVLLGNLIQRPPTAIPDDTVIQVYFKSYLQQVLGNLRGKNDDDNRKIQNALLAMYAHDLYVDLVDFHDDCDREVYCQRVAVKLMPEVASSLYLSSFQHDELDNMNKMAAEVFELLRNATELQLTQNATWLDEASKSDAVAKLKGMAMVVDGGASVFSRDSFLDSKMAGIALNDSSYIEKSLALITRYRRQLYSVYDADPNSVETMWSQFLHPYSTSGVSIYSLNTIVIPYGLMTWPLYEKSLPKYLQMAKLGFVIAHEMAHHFDANGIMFRPGSGKGDSIISQEVIKVFKQYTSRHSEYGGFGLMQSLTADGKSVNALLDGELSLNERLADDTAASIGWAAYTLWSPTFEDRLPWLEKNVKQLYFIALAQTFCTKSTFWDHVVELFEDEHLPASLRINGMIRNSNQFVDAFQCPEGAKMNPPEDSKCHVFPMLTYDDQFYPDDDSDQGIQPMPS